MTDTKECVLNSIKTRRSIREYQDRKISDEIIKEIIDAGIHAPNGLNFQPWFFAVVRNRDILNQISDFSKPLLLQMLEGSTQEQAQKYMNKLKDKNYDIFHNAPVLIIVFGEEKDDMSYYGCSMCALNMMLAAHSMGIGSCWIGGAAPLQQNRELMQKLKVPEGYRVIAPVVFGYPEKIPNFPGRDDPSVVWIN
ncbi:nitroreductase [Methanosalsum zhilinae DSM 4017]|uniref:Nitroreductase n=1 Tax=Methanosalsum zhilinae (strain DSM 4017 / NBRC 107636 / OCM 62 / WeN5) TaxID=679901 RepID=F7XNT8_METZD|nr:nitroreductase family protein [Methanosalsum zhilinae]AEH61293.1 nitroreductase [Methanosalsum zhilinae DSM 4017]